MTRRSLGVLFLLASACWKENTFFGPEPLDSSSSGGSSSSTSVGTTDATTSTTTGPPPASCGDGVVDPDEECDDGDDDSSDECLTTCKSARCGDGVQQLGKEQCDEGTENGPGHPCEPNCRPLLLKGNSATAPFPGGRSIAAADFDGDGTIDIAVSDDSDEVQLLLYNSTDKTLTPWLKQPVAGPAAELLAYDWTGDGKAELAAAVDEGVNSGVRVFEVGQMAPLAFLFGEPRSIALGDADADGILDLVIAQPEASAVQWALGTGAPGGLGATPLLSTPSPPVRVAAADVTDDGKADLVVSINAPGFLYFEGFQGEPIGPFTSGSLTSAADVVVARILPDTNNSVGVFDPQAIRMQRFGGDTDFVDSKTLDIAAGLGRPRHVALHDAFDDLVMINAAAGSLHILPFPKGEVLAEKPSLQGFGTIADFADADFDGDGFQDLVVLSANGIWILLNQT